MEEIKDFLSSDNWQKARIELLAADASFRRYFRLFKGEDSRVLMDAPPDREDPKPFIAIAKLLEELGLNAPKVLHYDLLRGLVLLTDLGDQTFTRALAAGANEQSLYRLGTDTLLSLQTRWREDLGAGIPPYSDEVLLREALLLTEWAWPALHGKDCPQTVENDYRQAWQRVFSQRPAGLGTTLVLRDFHVDNLMLLEGQVGVQACGLLDFQDALIGSPAYDLVSLLRDARRDVTPGLRDELLQVFKDKRPDLNPSALECDYWILGAQRTAKIIGIFTRLSRRDGKHHYLAHMPRLWRLFEEELAQPALTPVADWLAAHWPKELRKTPERPAQ